MTGRPYLPDVGSLQGRVLERRSSWAEEAEAAMDRAAAAAPPPKLRLVAGSVDRHIRDMRESRNMGELLRAGGAVEGPDRVPKPHRLGLLARLRRWLFHRRIARLGPRL